MKRSALPFVLGSSMLPFAHCDSALADAGPSRPAELGDESKWFYRRAEGEYSGGADRTVDSAADLDTLAVPLQSGMAACSVSGNRSCASRSRYSKFTLKGTTPVSGSGGGSGTLGTPSGSGNVLSINSA